MNNRLSEIFKVISFYDENRWVKKENYNLINFYKDDLDDDTKLLTHWFCYVSDRQMPFQRIWDIGGFVYSDLVESYKSKKTIDILDISNTDTYVNSEINAEKIIKYYFKSKAKNNSNIISDNYEDSIENERVKFKPRFIPSDYLSILYTLIILEEYSYSLTKFIIEAYNSNKNKDDYIKRILFSLHLLTYHDIGRPKGNVISDFSINYKNGINRKNDIIKILQNKLKFETNYKLFLKQKIYEQKRAICSFRDFLKSPEFKYIFKKALAKESFPNSDFDRLTSENSLTQLELPGDVWNNNSKFRQCILKNSEYENSKESLNKILREHYNNHTENITGYPEQFDTTFDFVPRMCESDNCEICPVNKIDHIKNDFDKVCIDDTTKFCPVVYIGCNYKNKCVGKENCTLFTK